MKLILTVFALFGMYALSGQAEDKKEPTYYKFNLVKGSSVPVCEAYLERLNTTVYAKPPFCGRPEATSVPGFTPLNRKPLTAEEAHTLLPRLSKFMQLRIQGSKEDDDAYEAMLKSNGVGPSIDSLETVKKFLRDGEIVAWRYDPLVDIDNDGSPDNVLVWQGYGLNAPLGVCGQTIDNKNFSTDGSQPQVAFVLEDSQERIDEKRTMELFGHPSGGYPLPAGAKSKQFRPMGKTLGIFKYKDIYYFDTFLEFSELERKPKGSPLLDVFLRKNGMTRRVCEYRMNKAK